MPMQELRDRVAVVTGAASGIGHAVAARLATEGMHLALADIEEAELAKTVTELGRAGGRVIGVPTDVSDAGAVAALAERALSEYGAVHLVANHAGVYAGGRLHELTLDLWRWEIGVNLWGAIHCCHLFVPMLVEQGVGHIVNTASLFGLGVPPGVPGLAAYATASFGVVGLSEAVQQELTSARSAVGVSVLCPGFVNTRLGDSDRNLPKWVPRPSQPKGSRHVRRVSRTVFRSGIDPSVVADAVVDAVREQRFYVLTHQRSARSLIEGRVQWAFEGTPVKVDLQSLVVP
jgi:NAD(P)-dependent dehydrogenase (short-subunit alcohol dehydrogenase family)